QVRGGFAVDEIGDVVEGQLAAIGVIEKSVIDLYAARRRAELDRVIVERPGEIAVQMIVVQELILIGERLHAERGQAVDAQLSDLAVDLRIAEKKKIVCMELERFRSSTYAPR